MKSTTGIRLVLLSSRPPPMAYGQFYLSTNVWMNMCTISMILHTSSWCFSWNFQSAIERQLVGETNRILPENKFNKFKLRSCFFLFGTLMTTKILLLYCLFYHLLVQEPSLSISLSRYSPWKWHVLQLITVYACNYTVFSIVFFCIARTWDFCLRDVVRHCYGNLFTFIVYEHHEGEQNMKCTYIWKQRRSKLLTLKWVLHPIGMTTPKG